MFHGLKAVIGKEVRHIRRDRKALTYVLGVPFVLVFIYGYGINIDLRDVRTAVIDESGGAASAALIQSLRTSGVFTLTSRPLRPGSASPLESAELDLKAGKIREILIIPSGFEENWRAGRAAEIGVVLDGSEAHSTFFLGRLHERLAAEALFKLRPGAGPALKMRFAFNPGGRSAVSIIPGLFVIILMIISAMMTSIAIAREKEMGSAGVLYLSPIASRNIILGKAIPYAGLAFFDGAVILFLAWSWFRIPIRGNLAALAVFSILFVVAGVSIGVLISTVFATQKEAMIAEVMAIIMPAFLLSGFIIPLESLPGFLRSLSMFVPAAHFMKIVRALVLKGTGVRPVLQEGAALLVFAVLFLSLATWNFSRQRRRPR